MALSDDRQKFMANDDDRNRGRVLDYQEAVHLTNPASPELKGEVRRQTCLINESMQIWSFKFWIVVVA